MNTAALPPRAAELVELLELQSHPEGGHYREFFRAAGRVQPADGRPVRSALTSIDFLLARGQHSAWHRVSSDELWHLLEGGPLRLWLIPPTLDQLQAVELGPADASGRRPHHVVTAHWWQAAEPMGDYAYVGATVAPGFEFADFEMLRDQPEVADALCAALPEAAEFR